MPAAVVCNRVFSRRATELCNLRSAAVGTQAATLCLGLLKWDNTLVPYLIDGAVDTEMVASREQCRAQLEKQAAVLIDTAPGHRSSEYTRHLPKGMNRRMS